MPSILTNIAAQSALQTLRSITANLNEAQQHVSSGLRISGASDNAAYWSISTTMRSDNKAISAVSDALGIGAATVDVAYSAMEAVADVLANFKAKLITAKEDGVDKAKVQNDLAQLKDQISNIAKSASFNGVNWLDTDIANMHDVAANKAYVTSAFTRSANSVTVSQTSIDLSSIALFNSTGDGLLQSDSRDIGKIGGIKVAGTFIDDQGNLYLNRDNRTAGSAGSTIASFQGPMSFSAGDTITFDITVDADNPANVPSPLNPGKTTSVTIDRALIDQVRPNNNGVIRNSVDYATVLNHALTIAGSGASSRNISHYVNDRTEIDPTQIQLITRENSGLDGSSIRISNFQSTVPDTGIANTGTNFGARGSTLAMPFEPYEVFIDGDDEDGVAVKFNFSINGQTSQQYSFNRTYVNGLLGVTDGKVQTAADQVALLKSLMSTDWPDLIIETNGGGVTIRSNNQTDRLAGSRTYIGFTNIDVSIEPLPQQNFMDIDIEQNPQSLDRYIAYVEIVSSDVISAAAKLGSLQARIEMQEDFAKLLMNSIQQGIGRLVDADMNEESTRLKALQTQQQLGVQALSIANSNADNIIALFR